MERRNREVAGVQNPNVTMHPHHRRKHHHHPEAIQTQQFSKCSRDPNAGVVARRMVLRLQLQRMQALRWLPEDAGATRRKAGFKRLRPYGYESLFQ